MLFSFEMLISFKELGKIHDSLFNKNIFFC
jgi:hypothetical protein